MSGPRRIRAGGFAAPLLDLERNAKPVRQTGERRRGSALLLGLVSKDPSKRAAAERLRKALLGPRRRGPKGPRRYTTLIARVIVSARDEYRHAIMRQTGRQPTNEAAIAAALRDGSKRLGGRLTDRDIRNAAHRLAKRMNEFEKTLRKLSQYKGGN